MNTLLRILAVAALAAAPSYAGPLARELVAAQAKWVLHFDAAQFRGTKVGEFYVQHALDAHLASAKAKHHFDFGPLARSLKSATAYGTDEKGGGDTGVLLLQASPEAVRGVADALKQWLAAEQAAPQQTGRIKLVSSNAFPLYHVDGETFIAPLADGRLLFGKSRPHVQKAFEVMAGRAANLASTTQFKELESGGGFFFAAAADGLNKNAALAPHAKIFRQTDEGRVVLGERGDQLALDVALLAEDAESATRVQQLITGLLAWATLDKSEDKDAQLLLKSAKVGAAERTVTVALEYPVARVLKKMADNKAASARRAEASAE
jgi:hypothetical protein